MTIFIVGIERSASTWVSNLIDSHPDTEVFMEPMSIFTTRFTQWPDRFKKIANPDERAKYFRRELQILKERKRWLLTQVSDQSIVWNIDLTLAEFLVRKKIASDLIIDFYELNFHRKNSYQYIPKSEMPRLDVVKSLRLNFNPDLILQIDPSAKLIITLRDMASNLRSILKQFERGHLSELRELLNERYGNVDEATVFDYWRESYNSLFHYVDNSSLPYFVFDHTKMLLNPNQVIKDLLDFIGLQKAESVINYLEASNRKGQGIHNTNRSHEELLQQTKLDRKHIYPLLEQKLNNCKLHPYLHKAVHQEK